MSNRIEDRINSLSVLPGWVPPIGKLKLAQIGINAADGKLFIRLTNGAVICVGQDMSQMATIAQLNEAIDNIPGSQIDDIEGLSHFLDQLLSQVEGKAETNHSHNVAGIDDLVTQLDSLEAAIEGKQPSGDYAAQLHGHGISEIAQLGTTLSAMQTAIDSKQNALVAGRDYPIVSELPPKNPQVKWQWRQIDSNHRAIDWVWNGTYWLSAQKHCFTATSANSISTSETFPLVGQPDSRLILLEELVAHWHHSSAIAPSGGAFNSTTDYWAARLLYLTGSTATAWTPQKEATAQGLTAAANTNVTVRQTLNHVYDMRDSLNNQPTGRHRGLYCQFIRIGSSSYQLRSPAVAVSYRWIYTP